MKIKRLFAPLVVFCAVAALAAYASAEFSPSTFKQAFQKPDLDANERISEKI